MLASTFTIRLTEEQKEKLVEVFAFHRKLKRQSIYEAIVDHGIDCMLEDFSNGTKGKQVKK